MRSPKGPLPYRHYIWQLPTWPTLTWDEAVVYKQLAEVQREVGELLGAMQTLGDSEQNATSLATQVDNIMQSSAIEGDLLPWHEVRSSLSGKLGLVQDSSVVVSPRVEGIVSMAMESSKGGPLTEERLHKWHSLIFPDGPRPKAQLYHVGKYRQTVHDPMVVAQGVGEKAKVYFMAPPAADLKQSMGQLIVWCNEATLEPMLKAAVAHLWFLTLHPYDDGNGRLARTLSDYFLTLADGNPKRYYSVAVAIMENKAAYYLALEQAQKGDADITAWMLYFLGLIHQAVQISQDHLSETMGRARFWQNHHNLSLNDRQQKVLNLLLGPFKGKLQVSKYAALSKCSTDTALRDLNELVGLGLLAPKGEGRGREYRLVPVGE